MTPEYAAHVEWIGYVQPVGLVVSPPAMIRAQAYPNRHIGPDHQRFLACLPRNEHDEITPTIVDFPEFAQQVLDWSEDDLIVFPTHEPNEEFEDLEVYLAEYEETLRPTWVVPAFKPQPDESPWVMLVQEIRHGDPLDAVNELDLKSRKWQASPHAKFERLLRETNVPIGLLSNGRSLRLVYAPRGETSGFITYNVEEMATVAGRPIFAAMHMLLEEPRMFSLGKEHRLPSILEDSRKYQNTVSTKLANQVMAALFEMLRGFQAANEHRQGDLLREILGTDPQHVYKGLLTVLMRLVFVMYAEDRGLMSSDAIYANHYSVAGLFDRLRTDAGRFPDTMNQRYGAWAQLLTLNRLIHEGGSHHDFRIPARKGYLFDPDRYPFLEGRAQLPDGSDDATSIDPLAPSPHPVPHVSDGCIYRVLESLLVLDGERLSYRTLDVEQIGSVYEAIMGFELEVARGRSIAIRPARPHGAPATINLETLLDTKPTDRPKRLKEWSDQKLSASDTKALKAAATIEDLIAALNRKVAREVTPNIVPQGAMVFQPSDERRRSGSHYTPRSLTEPIVRTTLEPLLNQLCGATAATSTTSSASVSGTDVGRKPALHARAIPAETDTTNINVPSVWHPTPADRKRYTKGEIELRIRASERNVKHWKAAREIGTPHPSQILDLKICDPAMGSGAFLVEVCRQLGDHLIAAWHAHDMVPADIPADEDEVLYARRLVAQRCLYGVDKNVMAVDLAKLSLWLVTLARDHAFTFLDHSLRHGDSLVGLTREQIIGFHWDRKKFKTLLNEPIQKRLDRATEARAKILNAREDVPYKDQEQRLAVADEALDLIRTLGDACVSCFFDPSPLPASTVSGQSQAAGSAATSVSGEALAAGTSPETGESQSAVAVAKSKPVKATKKSRGEAADRVYGLASSYLESQKQPQIDHASRQSLHAAAARLREGANPVPAFHWEIEFPEVFSRENGGFDAFVGNPPFLGGRNITNSYGDVYSEALRALQRDISGGADLVAHFYRRCFANLRTLGTVGLIATNTIAQGDTRSAGLRVICENNGTIYCARRRVRWPGVAAVIVSVVHIRKGSLQSPHFLDGNPVDRITAYLVHRGGHGDPKRLGRQHELSYQGSITLGMGFTFAEEDNGTVSSISRMNKLIEADSRNEERIFPYIGGEEVNSNPAHAFRRYVINFGEMTEEEARRWPDLMEIIEDRVKPERLKKSKEVREWPWWHFWRTRNELYEAISSRDRVLLTNAQASPHLAFVFYRTDVVFANSLNILVMSGWKDFGIVQSQLHETWARFFSSSMKDDLRYNPTDCLDTFAFPTIDWFNRPNDDFLGLTNAAENYHETRASLMVQTELGLTKTYNRFHSPDERDEGILELRRLHGLMDGAVLRAYGWEDLAESATCEFLLDYEEEEEAGDSQQAGTRRQKKKPWRYRWPDDFRDEVLARLLELNEQRHKEEQLTGTSTTNRSDKKTAKKKNPSKKTTRKESTDQQELFQE